jgi:hypothetical protein
VFSNNTNFSNITYTNTIIYNFTGNGLSVGTTPDTIKLLVWSTDTALGLSAYSIEINNGYLTKNITRTHVFSNSKYYKLPAISIPQPQTGDVYQGGIVCSTYVENGVTHGYVAALNDLGTYPWSPRNKKNEIDISTSTSIGSGETNTDSIVFRYGYNGINYAAYVCNNLSLNGFNDWFLPSQEELIMLYDSLKAKGYGFVDKGNYWSSTQSQYPYDLGSAVYVTFSKNGGTANTSQKSKSYYVRPIRRF